MNDRSRKKKQTLFWILSLAAGLALVFVFCCSGLGIFTPEKSIPPTARGDFSLMAQAWNTIQKVYVDRSAIKPRNLTYGAISGMVDALGDTGHSTFLSPQMVKAERDAIRGSYKGIGAEVRKSEGHVVIVAPIDGSPAQRAGLRPGDIILRVDGHPVVGLPLVQVVTRILGPAGTRVTLTILTPGSGQSRDITLTRASITLENVRWQPLPGTRIAQLRIASFSEGVSKALRKALQRIHRQGMQGIVLDLRDDPGGLLRESIDCSSQFLGSGNVLLEKDAHGKITPVAVKPGGIATKIPLVVLVNRGTASAAEIMAGALQDAGRALLVGEKTFGTGTVLQQFPLSDGSALLLATQEWLTPDGHTIWHKGITPNRVVALPAKVVPLFPEEERGMQAAGLAASRDRQLLTALTLLTGKKK